MRKRKLPSWISNPVELVQAQFESLAIGPRSSLQIAEELVDLLGTLDPLLSVDVEELIQDMDDVTVDSAVELIHNVRGEERALYWLEWTAGTNAEFQHELQECILAVTSIEHINVDN